MRKYELNSYVDNNLFCPKCGTQVIKNDQELVVSDLCKHVFCVAHDLGFEYSKNDKIITDYEDNEDYEEGIDKYLSNLEIENSLLILKYAPAPSFFGSYVIFDFSEN